MCITPLSAPENRQNKMKETVFASKQQIGPSHVSKCMLLLQLTCSRQKKKVDYLEALMRYIYIIYLVDVDRTIMRLSG